MNVHTTPAAEKQLLRLEDRNPGLAAKALRFISLHLATADFGRAKRIGDSAFSDGELWRFKVGNARVLVDVDHDECLVVGIGLRREAA